MADYSSTERYLRDKLTSLSNSTMSTSQYDADGDGIVDNSATLENQLGSYYLDWDNFTNKPTTIVGYGITDAFDGQFDSLYNLPNTLEGYNIVDAFSGRFEDLIGKPTTLLGYGITDGSDGYWEHILNKPDFSIVAYTGDYNDLLNKPAGGGSGTTSHSSLTDLDYSSSGHTGFASSGHTHIGTYIEDPGTSVDREILTWADTTGYAVRVSTGVSIDSNESVIAGGDIVAYSTGGGGTPLSVDNFKTWHIGTGSYSWGTSDVVAGSDDVMDIVAGEGITIETDSTAKAIKIIGNPAVSSQWVTSGSDIYYDTGSVGIGTSTLTGVTVPKLIVNGNVVVGSNAAETYISGVASGGAIKILSDSDTTARYLSLGYIDNTPIYTGIIHIPGDNATGVGNVGIGTTSPAKKLHIARSVNGETGVLVQNTYPGTSVQSSLFFGFNTADADPAYLAKIYTDITNRGSGTENVNMYLYTTVAGATASRLSIVDGNIGISATSPDRLLTVKGVIAAEHSDASQLALYNNGTISVLTSTYNGTGGYTPLYINTSDTTRIAILNDGKVGIGTTSPDFYLTVGDDATAAASIISINGPENQQKGLALTSAATTKWYMYNPASSTDLRFWNGSADRIIFTTAGGINAVEEITAYYSDIRLKTNIQPITNAIDKVTKLIGFTYNPNELSVSLTGNDDTSRKVGVSAQSLQEILPEAVRLAPFDDDNGKSKSGENYLTVQYEKIVPLLIEAIKELKQEIDKLKKV